MGIVSRYGNTNYPTSGKRRFVKTESVIEGISENFVEKDGA